MTPWTTSTGFWRLPSAPPTRESLWAKSVRHVHNILSGALGVAVPKLIPANPAAAAHPPARQIKAQEQSYPTVDDGQTARFLGSV